MGRKSRVGYFLLLSCLWEWCRFIGSNLYPVAECENSGIWTCGCLGLLPSSPLVNEAHSIDIAIFFIRSLCLCPIEFRLPSNSAWEKYIFSKISPYNLGWLQFPCPFSLQGALFLSNALCKGTRRHLLSAVSSSPWHPLSSS